MEESASQNVFSNQYLRQYIRQFRTGQSIEGQWNIEAFKKKAEAHKIEMARRNVIRELKRLHIKQAMPKEPLKPTKAQLKRKEERKKGLKRL